MGTSVRSVLSRVIATSLSAISLVAVANVPAQAVGAPVLPDGEHVFALDCFETPPKLWLVDETNAAATTLNSSTASATTCAQTAQADPRDGTPYVVYVENLTVFLGTVDTTTGVISKKVPISGAATSPEYLIITHSGDAFLASSGSWYSLDLVTGVTTLVGSSGAWLMWVSYNATTDTIYGFTQTSDDTADAFTIDRHTGEKTADPSHNVVVPAGTQGCPGSSFLIYSWTGATFDGAGNLWFLNDECASTLIVEDFSTGTTYVPGELKDAAQAHGVAPNYYVRPLALFISRYVPQKLPTLPNTGLDQTSLLAMGLLGSFGIAAGATHVIVPRVIRARRRRAS